MTDPAGHRRTDTDQANRTPRDTSHDMHVSEDVRRTNDPTKQVYGAYDNPDEAIRHSDADRSDDRSLFELMDGDETSDAVPGQPRHDGIGPFSSPVVLIVAALVIFVVLLVTFG